VKERKRKAFPKGLPEEQLKLSKECYETIALIKTFQFGTAGT
jgi:hypothetical protein